MKNLLFSIVVFFFIAICSLGCSKNSGSYSSGDNTVGMIKVRSWSGTSSGFYKGDTTIGTSIDTVWALYFSHNIVDTSFSVEKINGLRVNMLGYTLNYQSTDSLVTQTVLFDSNVAGAQTAILTYYYLPDSMTFQLNTVTGYNTSAKQYYQTNMFLHTNHG